MSGDYREDEDTVDPLVLASAVDDRLVGCGNSERANRGTEKHVAKMGEPGGGGGHLGGGSRNERHSGWTTEITSWWINPAGNGIGRRGGLERN